MSRLSIGRLDHKNYEIIKRIWESIDIAAWSKTAWEKTAKTTTSIIHKPAWEQARAFQDTHGQYLKRSASSNKIPHQLLSAIIFTEMTYDPFPLWFDDSLSLLRLFSEESTSVGPGQMNVSHLERWGVEGGKWKLGLRLHNDVDFAIDASARLLFELVSVYQQKRSKEAAKRLELEIIRMFRGKTYTPPGWRNYEPKTQLDADRYYKTEDIERDAWPTIAEWYNGDVGTRVPEYRRKFENSLHALGY